MQDDIKDDSVVEDRRTNKWMWGVVEVGIALLKEEGRTAAIKFFQQKKVPASVVVRVINHPEQRRK